MPCIDHSYHFLVDACLTNLYLRLPTNHLEVRGLIPSHLNVPSVLRITSNCVYITIPARAVATVWRYSDTRQSWRWGHWGVGNILLTENIDRVCSRGDGLAVRHGKMQWEIVQLVSFTWYYVCERLATLHAFGKRFRDPLWKTLFGDIATPAVFQVILVSQLFWQIIVCCILSCGWIHGVWILCADVSKHRMFHLHRRGGVSLWRWNRQGVPKRRRIKFRRWGFTRNKKIQHSKHVGNLKYKIKIWRKVNQQGAAFCFFTSSQSILSPYLSTDMSSIANSTPVRNAICFGD